jgi:hypothetical protein
MVKKGFYSSVLLALLTAMPAWAAKAHHGVPILPENNMRISVFSAHLNGMTEATFNQIIDRVEEVYSPIVKQLGGDLYVERNWTDETVNAYADRQGTQWSIHMYGGLARHQAVTEDGFMLVVCHELGHHLGGAPKIAGFDWATNEGGADYFGALKCMRRVLYNDDNIAIMGSAKVDADAKAKCDATYSDDKDRALCARVAMAGKSLSDLFDDLSGTTSAFNTPDKTVVKRTNDDHPETQCRLDTYFQASLCTKDFNDDVSDTDPKRGTCVKADGFTVGMRPLCWYKPKSDEN